MRNLLLRLVPFLFLGIMIVLFIVGIIVFSYLLIVGALVGVGLFVIAWLRQLFFSSKKELTKSNPQKRTPRTFDHDK